MNNGKGEPVDRTHVTGGVLGREKEPDPDDPMELVMVPLPGVDPEFMVTCIIEEYARLGMGEEEIFRLFSRPTYQTHEFYRTYGETWVRDLIRKVLSRTGQLRVSVKYRPQSSELRPQTSDQEKSSGFLSEV